MEQGSYFTASVWIGISEVRKISSSRQGGGTVFL